MSTNDGGPAFPVNEIVPERGHWDGIYEVVQQHSGLSLLDYFAGQAMASLLSARHGEDENSDTPVVYIDGSNVTLNLFNAEDQYARISYGLAEAMLRERERRMKQD